MDTDAQRNLNAARLTLLDALEDRLDVWQTAAVARMVEDLARLVAEDPAPPACLACASRLVQPATGRPRAYCSDACRQQAARSRSAR